VGRSCGCPVETGQVHAYMCHVYLWANIQQRTTMRSRFPHFSSAAFTLRVCVWGVCKECVCLDFRLAKFVYTFFTLAPCCPTHNFILKCLPKRQFHSFFFCNVPVVFHSLTYGTKPGPHY